jgi:hypothetical protein
MRILLTVTVLVLAGAASASAQGTLSAQGYGYPAGPLSTRALTMGGSVSELDPISAVNPAALTTWGRSGLYGQFGPEFRTVDANGTSEQSTLIRFPLFAGALAVNERLIFGISFSNVLDRTWSTQISGFYPLQGGDSVAYRQQFSSKGALTNARFAGAYRLTNTLRFGVALHFYTGESNLTIVETFADSSFGSFGQVTVVDLSGTAASAGIAWSPIPTMAVGLSGQLGGIMHARRNDTLVTNGRVPGRAGISVLYAGVPGVSIAADAEWNQWSAMNGLAASSILAVDTWDYGIGAEIKVGEISGSGVPLRIGYRYRGLPFQADSQNVTEHVFSFGGGIPLAQNRARIDLGVLLATRKADLPVQEHAWTMSIGILVRP